MDMTTNAYAILSAERGEAVLIDANVEYLFPFVQRLHDDGYTPVALLRTHQHPDITGGSAIKALQREYGLTAFLHPNDVLASQSDIGLEDPTDSDLLAAFDLDVELFAGHTRGSMVVYGDCHGGVLFTGNAAMGAIIDETQRGVERLIRPPVEMNVDDGGLRQRWVAFDRPITGIAPHHGTVYLDRGDDVETLLEPLRRRKPTIGGS